MTHYCYLTLDVLTVLVPFIFSFHPRIKYYQKFLNHGLAALPVATVFLIWDYYFTKKGFWGFNPDYVLGSYLFNLPLEEVFFFIAIPFSSLFTIHCLHIFLIKKWPSSVWTPPTFQIETSAPPKWIHLILLIPAIISVIFWQQNYTRYTFLLLFVLLYFSFRNGRNLNLLLLFAFGYPIVLIPFLLVNGTLTGSFTQAPVVWYNPQQMIGFRVLTIPIEDFFYGFDLLFGIALLSERLTYGKET